MRKNELIICGVIVGLLVKIIENQKTIDDHIYKTNRRVDGYYDSYVYDFETLKGRTLAYKIKELIKNHKGESE